MSGLETIIGSRVHTSFLFAGMYVPANSLSKTLQLFTAPALFHTEGLGEYHLSKGGSLFKVRIESRYFCLVSAHQVLGGSSPYEHDQICLHNPISGAILTSHKVVFVENDPDLNYDISLYEFTESVEAGKLQETGWFPLDLEELKRKNPKPLKVLCIGYPSFRNSFDYEAKEYAVAPNAVWGEETEPKIDGYLAFSPNPKITYDPAGMSGAPVFGIHIPKLEPTLFFAGLLTNASSKVFHFVTKSRLAFVFEDALDK